ncbi:hypothetical protein [Sphingomonas phyllosphaerae]|uniref:hypothetical protein n=1 Tax=Sphingomonas phyllosphaerae TaxID=257003 RepID=UPI0012DD2CEF|nr:hypothetical protein [Sphingomonas phyllosphaerae]
MRYWRVWILMAALLLYACDKPTTVELVAAGKAEVCTSPEVLEQLNTAILPGGTKPGVSLIAVEATALRSQPEEKAVECAASMRISRDGKTPWSSTAIDVAYRVQVDLVNPRKITLFGSFSQASYSAAIVLRALRVT